MGEKVSEELSADIGDDAGELGEVLLLVVVKGLLSFGFTRSKGAAVMMIGLEILC
jgi:hypothetical protein